MAEESQQLPVSQAEVPAPAPKAKRKVPVIQAPESQEPAIPGYMRGGFRPRKYIVTKADGSLVDSQAIYFVLRLDEDPHAIAATRAYAESVQGDNPDLARDLKGLVQRLERIVELKHLVACCRKMRQTCGTGGMGSFADGLAVAMDDLVKEAGRVLEIMGEPK